MSGTGRCAVRSAATARRCTLSAAHVGPHQRRSRSGRLLEEWPRTANDADHVQVCTKAELIDHLDDLIDLAKWEGFGIFVGALLRARREIAGGIYAPRKRKRARPDPLFGWARGPRRDPPRH